MPKKNPPAKKQTSKASSSPEQKGKRTKINHLTQRGKAYLSRRPHRTLRRTRRRDYVRSLQLPGYIAFTGYVISTLRKRWRTMLTLVIVFVVISGLLVGIASQDVYQMLTQTLQETSTNIFTGGWGEIGKAGLLFVTIASGNIGGDMTEAQQIYSILVFLMLWLSTVWLLRAQLASKAPRFRDALYNAGSPIVPTLLVAVVFIMQLVPAALAIIAYNAAMSTNFLTNGVVAMVFFLVLLGLCLLSLYLVTSTFIALVVVTLPGMYPWQAIRTAGDMVIGRRVRILLRLVWLAVVVAISWLVIMLPVILLVSWLQGAVTWVTHIPIIPVMLLIMGTLSTVFIASYIYLLYRKVVDDDASPA